MRIAAITSWTTALRSLPLPSPSDSKLFHHCLSFCSNTSSQAVYCCRSRRLLKNRIELSLQTSRPRIGADTRYEPLASSAIHRVLIAMLISDYINWFGIFCIGVAFQQALITSAPVGPPTRTSTASVTATVTATPTVTDERRPGISITDHGESHAGLV